MWMLLNSYQNVNGFFNLYQKHKYNQRFLFNKKIIGVIREHFKGKQWEKDKKIGKNWKKLT